MTCRHDEFRASIIIVAATTTTTAKTTAHTPHSVAKTFHFFVADAYQVLTIIVLLWE